MLAKATVLYLFLELHRVQTCSRFEETFIFLLFCFSTQCHIWWKIRTAILPKALCAVQTTALILFMLVPNVLKNPRATFKSENSMWCASLWFFFFFKAFPHCFCWYTMILLRLNDNPLTVVFKHTTSEFCCLISFSLWESFIFFSLHSTSLFSNLLDYVQLLLLIRMLTGRLCLVLFCFLFYSLFFQYKCPVQSLPDRAIVLLYC